MKKMRKKDKGFTLIELLVTITIVTLITTIATIGISKIIDVSNEKKKDITVSTIKKSANQYTEEFKSSDKYWFRYDNVNNNEYSCTTVGMLINKGFLKEDIIGVEIEFEEDENGELKKVINENTSVKIDRNSTTKVYNTETIEFNSEECGQSAEIDINFEVMGENTNCTSGLSDCDYKDWFNKDVTIRINATNFIQIDEANYTININNSGEKSIEELIVNNEKSSNWNIVVGDQGKNIDVCANIIDLKGNNIKFCLDEENLKYSMDKEAPSAPTLTFYPKASGNNHKITSTGSEDKKNITSTTDLDYYIDDLLVNQIVISSEFEADQNVELVNSYVKDEAGNTSLVTSKKLTLKKSSTTPAETITKYYCDFYPDVLYDNIELARQNCSKKTNVSPTEVITYDCDLDTKEYTDKATAEQSCYTTTDGTKTYSCDWGDTRSGTTCYYEYSYYNTTTVTGGCTDSYPCKNGYIQSSQGSRNCSDKGCPRGYDKLSWSCPGEDHAIPSGACSSAAVVNFSCTNYCGGYEQGTSTYSADCSCSISGKSCSDCKKYNYGTVSKIYTYVCSLDNLKYSSKNDAINNCVKTDSGTTKSKTSYYCSFTGKNYTTQNEAQSKCTNYCSLTETNGENCYLFENAN